MVEIIAVPLPKSILFIEALVTYSFDSMPTSKEPISPTQLIFTEDSFTELQRDERSQCSWFNDITQDGIYTQISWTGKR